MLNGNDRWTDRALFPPHHLKRSGCKGQKKLLKGKVLIIGAGGLGAPAAMYLAAAGVGTIGIVDADEVDLSNLQRQIIHSTADIGKAKVKSAKETMNAMNPDVEVKTYRMFVDASNIRELIRVILSLTEQIIFRQNSWSTMHVYWRKNHFPMQVSFVLKVSWWLMYRGRDRVTVVSSRIRRQKMPFRPVNRQVLSERWVVSSDLYRRWKRSSIWSVSEIF